MIVDLILLSYVFKVSFYYALIDAFVYDTILFFLTLSFWFPARYITFDDNSILMLLLKHLGAAIVSSIIWVHTGYLILKFIFNISGGSLAFLETSLNLRYAFGASYYVIIVALYYLYIYYTNFQEKLIRESELKSYIKEAELKSLKYQINPHFIFNSLNSISSLTMIDPNKAREMTIKLSSYLRSTLANNEKQQNSLEEELNNAKLYVEIEKIRFGDKFDYVEEIESGCKAVIVPSMILQPLIENAIKYGVYESLEKVLIKLNCKTENEYLTLTVQNNFDDDTTAPKGEKIGLKNIRNRLSLIYNQENLLVTKKENKIFTAKLFIPVQNGK